MQSSRNQNEIWFIQFDLIGEIGIHFLNFDIIGHQSEVYIGFENAGDI